MRSRPRTLHASGVTVQRGETAPPSVPLSARLRRIARERGVSGLARAGVRRGLRALFFRPFVLQHFYCPWLRLTRTPRTFTFDGRSYPYFYHSYNTTWDVERTVEIPVAWDLVSRNLDTQVLEVGNVLSYYFPVSHTVVDKFESVPGVVRQDILDFRPDRLFDLIVSISTLEHVGWDDDEKDAEKPIAAIQALQSMLGPAGILMVTIPIAYNPPLDLRLVADDTLFQRRRFLRRVSAKNRWVETDQTEALRHRYGHPYTGANALFIGTYAAPRTPPPT